MSGPARPGEASGRGAASGTDRGPRASARVPAPAVCPARGRADGVPRAPVAELRLLARVRQILVDVPRETRTLHHGGHGRLGGEHVIGVLEPEGEGDAPAPVSSIARTRASTTACGSGGTSYCPSWNSTTSGGRRAPPAAPRSSSRRALTTSSPGANPLSRSQVRSRPQSTAAPPASTVTTVDPGRAADAPAAHTPSSRCGAMTSRLLPRQTRRGIHGVAMVSSGAP